MSRSVSSYNYSNPSPRGYGTPNSLRNRILDYALSPQGLRTGFRVGKRVARSAYSAYTSRSKTESSDASMRSSQSATPGSTIVASGGYRGRKTTFKKPRKSKKAKRKAKSFQRFSKKVNRVLNQERAYGHHQLAQSTRLHQGLVNTWNVIKNSTSTGTPLFEFFMPAQFKDAEAVLFNGKAGTVSSYTNAVVNSAIPNNFDTNAPTHVVASHVKWKFVNTSQHPTFLEMYKCTSKRGSVNAAAPSGNGLHPVDMWISSGATDAIIGNLSTAPQAKLTSCSAQAKAMNDAYDCKLTKFKLEPGQVQDYFMQGPKNFKLNEQKLAAGNVSLNTPTWRTWSSPGCGTIVFFRVLNEVSLGSSGHAAHFPHSSGGGIACTYHTYYRIRAPTQDSDEPTNLISNTISGIDDFMVSPGNDQQVDPENPSTVPGYAGGVPL